MCGCDKNNQRLTGGTYVIAIAKESFQSCLTERKAYDVLSIEGQYILFTEDSNRLVWNSIGIFTIEGVCTKTERMKTERMKTNYNFI